MQLREMIDEIRYIVGDQPDSTELITMLNRTMRRVARDLQFPQYHLEVSGVTAQFNLPSGAVPGGLVEIRRMPNATPLKVYTPNEAHRRYPDWQNWSAGDTAFVVFDPKMNGLSGEIRPVPLPESGETEKFLITYIATPADMDALDDEPFDGQLDEYHEMLVFYVVYQILLRTGDQRRAEFYAQYEKLAGEAYTSLRPDPVYARNPLYDGIFNA